MRGYLLYTYWYAGYVANIVYLEYLFCAHCISFGFAIAEGSIRVYVESGRF